MSTKRLQAQMIRNHTKTSYNNTRVTTIYANILSMDEETNKNMLLQYKYPCFIRYYNTLLQGNISQSTKMSLSKMLTIIIANLTQEEYNLAFQIEPPVVTLPRMADEIGRTFYVVNRNTAARNYFIFKNVPPNFLLKLNTFYTFDISDPSNLNTKLSFSRESDSGTPYRGIYYTAEPGTPDAKLIFNIYDDINTLKLYTFNDMRMYVRIKYVWGYNFPYLLTHLYKINPEKKIEFQLIHARQYSELVVYESTGPKYGISDKIESVVFFGENLKHYAFTYGTYYLDIEKAFMATLLNKGYEDSVVFIGDDDKKVVSTVQGVEYANGPPNEGEYSFYYGRVKMIVYKPFPFNMTVYSKNYGIMGDAGLFHFTNKPHENATNVLDLSLFKINVLYINTILRFDFDTSNSTKRKYGLRMGVYTLDIVDNVPIAFMNYKKEDIFVVEPSGPSVGSMVAPDGNTYLMYTGIVKIRVKGYFETISICTTNGYSGGYKLLAYNSYRGSPLPLDYKTKDNVRGLCAQTNFSISEDYKIHFNDDMFSNYGLYRGTYMIFNIPSECPITLLNRGKETLVSLESLQENSTVQGTIPDGTIYTFYYGILRITVQGDFGFMSLYTLTNDYRGGYKMFSYDSFFDTRDSYLVPASIPVIQEVASNTSFTELAMDDFQYKSLEVFTVDTTLDYNTLWEYSYPTNRLNIGTYLSFNTDIGRTNQRYDIVPGVYIVHCVSRYITIVNKGKENKIALKGKLSKKAIASDGNEYTFYSGDNLAIYVYDFFDLVSLEVLGGPVGNFILIYRKRL